MFFRDKTLLSHGIFLALIAYFFFALASTFVRLFPPSFPTLQILFFQSVIALACLLYKNYKTGKKLTFHTSLFSYHLLRGLSGVLSYLCFYLTIKYANLVDAAVLNATSPFYIPFIWYFLTKEKIEKQVFWAIILGFIGVAFILKPEGTFFHPGSLIGLLTGLLSAFAVIGISLLNRAKEPTNNIIFYFFLISSLALFPFLPAVWETPSLKESFLLIAIGISTFFAQSFLAKAFQYGTAAFLSPLSYSTIIYITLISYVFLDVLPSWASFVGILLVIIGGTTTFILTQKPSTFKDLFSRPQSMYKWWHFWKK